MTLRNIFSTLITTLCLLTAPLHTNAPASKPRILLIHLAPWAGGDGVHSLSLYKMLKKHGYHVSMLVSSNSAISKQLIKEQLTCHQARTSWYNTKELTELIKSLCRKEQISIIHCNYKDEVPAAVNAAQALQITSVFTYHLPYHFNTTMLKGLDSFICVNQPYTHYFDQENRINNLGVKNIAWTAPLYDINRCIDPQTSPSRRDFFKQFNLTPQKGPVICMIGNMYDNLKHKNYPLLFQAIKELVYTKNKPIHVLIAGTGSTKKHLEQLAAKMNLNPYIHFLGFVQNIPDLLHHTDFMVLTSSQEAFGIAFLEAGLMKRAAIGAQDTGAESIILHEKTGLLFKKDDVADLVIQIERLIDNQELAQALGRAAYNHVNTNFNPEVIFSQIEAIYHQ